MKKLIALVLAVVLCFSLAACGSKGPDLLGKYETTIDLTALMVREFDIAVGAKNLTLADYIDDFKVKIYFEFKEDGTHVQSFDKESVTTAMETLKKSLIPYIDAMMLQTYIDTFATYNVTANSKEDIEKLFGQSWDNLMQDALGTTIEGFTNDLVDTIAGELLADEILAEGNYKADNGKLHMSYSLDEEYLEEAYETYEIDGDTVTITSGVNVEEDEALPYPIVLTKVS